MGEAYIIRRGGGGMSPFGAVIHVNAPKDSDVSFSKGGVIAKMIPGNKGHINASNGEFADYYFSIGTGGFGEWEVTATRGESKATETLTISEAKQYDLPLSYRITPDYQEVEYLEKRGNKVIIDTGIMCTRNAYVLVNYYMIDFSYSVASQFFGSTDGGNRYFALQTHDNNARIWAYNTGISLNSGVAESRLQKWTKVRYQEGTKIECLDENDAILATATGVSQADPAYSISIFAMHTSATGYNSSDGTSMRLGIIWLDDNELIPCYRKSDSAPGYFNAKTKEFYENTGTGTIYLGPDL